MSILLTRLQQNDYPSITNQWVMNKIFARSLTSHLRMPIREPWFLVPTRSYQMARQTYYPFRKEQGKQLLKTRRILRVSFPLVGSRKRHRELENPLVATETASTARTLSEVPTGSYHSMALIKRPRLTVTHVQKPDPQQNRHDTVKPFDSVSHPWPIDQKGDPVFILNQELRQHLYRFWILPISSFLEIYPPQASATEYIAQRPLSRIFLPIVDYGYNPNRLITYRNRTTIFADQTVTQEERAIAELPDYPIPVYKSPVQDPPSIIQPITVRHLVSPTFHSPSLTILEDSHYEFIMPEYDNPVTDDYDVMDVRSEHDGKLFDTAREDFDAKYQTPVQEQTSLVKERKKRPLVNKIILQPRSSSPDVFLSEEKDKDSNNRRRSYEDNEVSDSSEEQWRVGRIPGHQGCHSMSGRKGFGMDSERSGQKRSLSQVCSLHHGIDHYVLTMKLIRVSRDKPNEF